MASQGNSRSSTGSPACRAAPRPYPAGRLSLASLAVALGLVALAGRGGALDANVLYEALDTIGRQAETGRLVTVISHLRSVAEAMDRVLAVIFGTSGSQVRWLGGDERDELITEDVEASLLTDKRSNSTVLGSGAAWASARSTPDPSVTGGLPHSGSGYLR